MNTLPTHIIRAIQQVFANYSGIEKAVLYGSRVKGTAKNGSDIDLVIFGKSLIFNDLLKIETDLAELDSPYFIDVCIYHAIQNPDLCEHIKRVGILFYQKELVVDF